MGLPSLVLNALGIAIDLYDDKNIWEFISAFLILRAIALVVAFVIVAFTSGKGLGDVAILWLATTWISTVILGAPISAAVFENEMKGRIYGILAAISSFIFQLPFQIFFLECHVLEEEYLHPPTVDEERKEGDVEKADTDADTPQKVGLAAIDNKEHPEESVSTNKSRIGSERAREEGYSGNRLGLWLKFARRRDIWKKVMGQIAANPVLWAIFGGFLLTLTTLGPTYLKSASQDFVPGLGWISDTLTWLGDTVSPIALLTMGIWMQDQGRAIFGGISHVQAVLFMIAKLVITPLIMVGLAQALHLEDEQGRAAVLIAALPISMASFSLADRYGIGEATMAANVALGNLLILPTVLVWNLVLDECGLFPIPASETVV